MKKTLALLMAVLMAVSALFCLASCGAADKGTFVLGFDAEYPPYGYLDAETNQYVGFDLEYAAAVCDKLGYTLELKPIDWDSKDLALESGEIDCIWSGFTINGREDQYEWTVPYVDNSIVVLTTSDSGIAALADLAGKKVTVQAGSSGQSALDENTELTASFEGGAYVTCADYTTAYQDLKTGAVDAIVIDTGVAAYFVAENEGYVILDETVSKEQYGVGFLKGNTAQCKEFSDAMEDIAKNTTTVTDLAAKYGISDSVIIGK